MNIDEMSLEELNVAVAERVMGETWYSLPKTNQWGLCSNCGRAFHDDPRERWDLVGRCYKRCEYSTDIAAAMQVVEKIAETEFLYPQLVYSHSWCFKIWRNNPMVKGDYGWIAEEYAETAPLAICRAALKAVEK